MRKTSWVMGAALAAVLALSGTVASAAQRVWVPAHWEVQNHHRVHVKGHYEVRRGMPNHVAARADRDRDGVPNRVDRDRDGDGVRNSADRAPNDPRYR